MPDINTVVVTPTVSVVQVNSSVPGSYDSVARLGLGWYDVTEAQYGILADGTDQTTALTTLFGTNPFSDAEFGGVIYIPYGVEFNYETVTAALPIGAQLLDLSSKNYHFTGVRSGTGTGYKNKVWAFGEAGRANDDQLFIVRTGHHAAMVLQNLGTAEDSPGVPSASATARLCSYAYAVARLSAGDPLYSFFTSSRKSTSSPDRWVWRLRAMSTYAGFAADPETAATDSTIQEIDENGQVGHGGAAIDGTMVYVKQSPLRNSGADTTTAVQIDNTNTSSEVLVLLKAKNAAGTSVVKRIRMSTDADTLGRLDIRSNANSQIWSIDDDGSIREYAGKREPVAAVTAAGTTTLDQTYRNVFVDATNGSVIIAFPSASTSAHIGRRFTITRTDSTGNTVTLSATISGTANRTLAQYGSITVQSDGVAWYLVGSA